MVGIRSVDNSGEPLETQMIDGEPYSVEDLEYMRHCDPDFYIWYEALSPEGKHTVDAMLEGK